VTAETPSVTLTHTILPDADAVTEHTDGWSRILDHLAEHVAGQH
jgi:hypothetical protein